MSIELCRWGHQSVRNSQLARPPAAAQFSETLTASHWLLLPGPKAGSREAGQPTGKQCALNWSGSLTSSRDQSSVPWSPGPS